MRGDAESTGNPRVLLPLPPLLNGQQYGQSPLDVSTSGPVTVLLEGLFAVQVNDIGGVLVPDAPVNIRLTDTTNLPPNINFFNNATFSPTWDRVALVSSGILVIADIVRDENQKITGLTNPTVVANLFDIGSPSDSSLGTEGGFTGFPDFSPDGNRIAVSIYGDLWLLNLDADGHTLLSSQPVTRTPRDTESRGVFSPDGSRLAYIGGRNDPNRGVLSRSANLFTINLDTMEVTQVTRNQDTINDPGDPAWSPDGLFLAFTARGERSPRDSSCGLVNYEIYEIKADGTSAPTLLTNPGANGVEGYSQWGW
jgi:dipeptidyl aminopeptidase/acylaminoacyl peptidase